MTDQEFIKKDDEEYYRRFYDDVWDHFQAIELPADLPKAKFKKVFDIKNIGQQVSDAVAELIQATAGECGPDDATLSFSPKTIDKVAEFTDANNRFLGMRISCDASVEDDKCVMSVHE